MILRLTNNFIGFIHYKTIKRNNFLMIKLTDVINSEKAQYSFINSKKIKISVNLLTPNY